MPLTVVVRHITDELVQAAEQVEALIILRLDPQSLDVTEISERFIRWLRQRWGTENLKIYFASDGLSDERIKTYLTLFLGYTIISENALLRVAQSQESPLEAEFFANHEPPNRELEEEFFQRCFRS